jgi:alpha 1,2-mannosyltransferase
VSLTAFMFQRADAASSVKVAVSCSQLETRFVLPLLKYSSLLLFSQDTLARVVVALRLIRRHFKSDLPAAIFHFPSERPDPNSPLVSELQQLNAKLVEATGRDRDPTREKNYQLKAQSIVECEWAEVIYFDSDNLPATNPEVLFDAPNYKRLGVFFAPDYWKTSGSNPIWQIIGVQCRDEWEQEAGQIIIDKRRHLDAMLLSLYMLTDWQYWFYFSDGDKDVFRYVHAH